MSSINWDNCSPLGEIRWSHESQYRLFRIWIKVSSGESAYKPVIVVRDREMIEFESTIAVLFWKRTQFTVLEFSYHCLIYLRCVTIKSSYIKYFWFIPAHKRSWRVIKWPIMTAIYKHEIITFILRVHNSPDKCMNNVSV